MFELRSNRGKIDYFILGSILFLLSLSTFVLYSVSPDLYPNYFIYIVLAVLAFWTFVKIEFDVLLAFSTHLYVLSILFLLLLLIIGQVTRGAVRWIPLGSFTIQPSEIVRPFLLLFFAKTLTTPHPKFLNLIKSGFFAILPVFLILIQPSLGVMILTLIGFAGIFLASNYSKKYIVFGIVMLSVLSPFIWLLLKPYQRVRVETFINPYLDPRGAGYNSIQP